MNRLRPQHPLFLASSAIACVAGALLVIPTYGVAEPAQGASRAWDFDLATPGAYSLQIEHALHGTEPGSTRATYTITVGGETQSREHELVVDRPFIPLRMQLKNPEHIHVVISGISLAALQHTNVEVLRGDATGPDTYAQARTTADLRELRAIRALLQRPPDEIDFARAKVAIDKLVDAATDAHATLRTIDLMVSQVRLMPEFGDSGDAKVRALKRYLYEPGLWNGNRPFKYDLDDPLGHNIHNKLLATYLTTRQGNCVTMPLLFVILGQRLGVDLTLSTAPRHFLVKFNSQEYGRWINLEATSGGNPARDVWLRKQFPSITDESLANGLYLEPLPKKEAVAAMTEIVAESHYQKREYDKAIAVSTLALQYYPKDIGAITLNGVAYLRLLHERFLDRYPSADKVPLTERGYYQYLAQNNQARFAKAQALGWRQPTREEDEDYLENVDRARQQRLSSGREN